MDSDLSAQSGSAAAGPHSCCGDSCYAAPELAVTNDPDRAPLIRRAFTLEYMTVGWMVVEAEIAIWSGIRAGSVSLLAFGIDSLIELASAGVLIWRLTVELRRGQVFCLLAVWCGQ